MKKNYSLLLVSICIFANSEAQTIRQYMINNKATINPAFVGTTDDVVGSVVYNQQWMTNFPGAPRNVVTQASGRLGLSNAGMGGGFSFQQYGVQQNFGGYLSFAYGIQFKKERKLSFGVSGSFNYIQENGSSLATTLPGDDAYKQNTHAYEYNAGLGVTYTSKKLWIGFAVPKLIQNNFDYVRNRNKVGMEKFNFNIAAGYDLGLGKDFHFLPSILFRSDKQERYNADFNLNFKYKEAVWFGPYYRANAAFGFILGVGITKYLKLSYAGEIPQTKFRNASYGSHEIMLGFNIPKSPSRIAQSSRYF